MTWKVLGENQKAIEFYNKALAINLAVFGENHPNIAYSYNNLGGAWKAQGKNQKAIEFYNKALAIFMHFFGPDHPNTKTVAGNIQSLKE